MENGELIRETTLENITQVEKEIQENINHFYQDKNEIEARLVALEKEWDVETILQTEGAAISIAGILLGLTANKKWLLLPLATSLIMLTGSLQGLSRPIPLLRKLGFRTRAEIDKEKYALKALRGDFKYLLDVPNVVWNAVNK